MSQNFLLSSKCCDMSRDEIDDLDEVGAINYFSQIRWGCDGKQVCPECGAVDSHYWRKKRKRWRCKHCSREFSVLVGTVFQDSKISCRNLLKAMFRYCAAAKGLAALELRREFKIHYKSAWLITCKLREVLMRTRNTQTISGLIHVDGGYFGGKRRHPNRKVMDPSKRNSAIKAKIEGAPSQPARRKWQLMPGGKANAKRRKNRRVVLVLRELSSEPKQGATRTIVTVAMGENEDSAIAFARKYVQDDSVIMSDESGAYSRLSTWYTHFAVQHSIEHCDENGVNNNQAESYFSRLRRAEYGVFHRYTPRYMMDYANESAWREDVRRFTVREKFHDLLWRVGHAGRSRWFRGYFQGNRRKGELLNQ